MQKVKSQTTYIYTLAGFVYNNVNIFFDTFSLATVEIIYLRVA